eukprot:TRINITY_DN14106_c0_g1_i1.p1 TRINITY_DN14106_c0_g1~~TRINITY_DN14106_c0_g1_i1.p1  ORF type:complete len:1140 (+),score=199.66 TRINITY_DN14106_c0_g1_i1:512-3421(+)
MANSMGLGLYYFLITTPVETNVCVLGKSGRLVVLNRKPLMSAVEAATMLKKVGLSIMMLTLMVLIYFRSVERAIFKARTSTDPSWQAKADQLGPVGKLINGKVYIFTFIFMSSYWIFNYFVLKSQIRPWGYSDEKNMYESKDASCAQYFRTGIRGMPGIGKPKRAGGMRIFFGPYPAPPIFWHIGSGQQLCKALSPSPGLPVENDNSGYPKPGGGQPRSAEDEAGYAQIILGSINSFLGSLGLFFFGLKMYNLLVNMQNCPIGGVVSPCVVRGECTNVAKAPWFMHHLQSKKLRTTEQITRDQMMPAVDINTIGLWLGSDTVGSAKGIVLDIAKEACATMKDDLITSPNQTVHGLAADTMGKWNAKNHLDALERRKLTMIWDKKAMNCQGCVSVMTNFYFSNIDNLIELFEIFMLAISAYVTALVYSLMHSALVNCPMIDIEFENDPSLEKKVDVHKTERKILNMIGSTFFFRYHYSGLPENMEKLEHEIQKGEREIPTTKRSDPYTFNSEAKSWDEYDLFKPLKARLLLINKELLGILKGEEVVAAWTEVPRLTNSQKLIIYGGFFLFALCPLCCAAYRGAPKCLVEAVIAGYLHYRYVEFTILRRRPQAAIIVTTRRIFQVTRSPAYKDLWGKVEPLLKMDVLVHNCGITYGTMTMEAFVPFLRRMMAKVSNVNFIRRGQAIVQGKQGIFKIWRDTGDTREIFSALSRITFLTKVDKLDPKMGEGLMKEEKELKEQGSPDPGCSFLCCPYTPPPQAMGDPKLKDQLIDRYLYRIKGEKDVYGRKLQIRPITCGQLFCGRGFNIECSCCCCCQLDELLTEFMVTTHRILVEQRAAQRYCRLFSCARKTPNIRTTFLAHNQAAAYLNESTPTSMGVSKVRQDLTIKLLQTGAREYQAGLMLHQKPYLVLQKKDLPVKDKIWVTHIAIIYDIMTQQENMTVDSEGESVEDNSEEDDFYDGDFDDAEGSKR